MKINRQQLTDALAKVKPGLVNNEMIEQSTHFIFDDLEKTFPEWPWAYKRKKAGSLF